MKKINLLFVALMLVCSSAQSVFAQDAVYNDIDRANWVATAPPYSPTDNAVGIDGKVAGPEYLLDGDQGTFLAFVKPGKIYNNVTGPASLEDLYFTIDLGAAQTFNYFRLLFRTGNAYDYLRPWAISIYGSNGTGDDRAWTLITDMLANEVINLPNAEGNGGAYTTGNVLIYNATAYSSVKVVYRGMSTSTSGSTLQVGEFFLGNITYDKVLYKPADVSFGDILQGESADRTLTVTGANLASQITYTLGGEDASAFAVTPEEWTSTGGTALITFAPTARKAYNATLTINSTGALESQTIALTGNADFDLPVQISGDTEHWYYIQFARQAANGKVLTDVNAAAAGDAIRQLPLDTENPNQLWKVTGTWDNYLLENKSGHTISYIYEPAGEDPGTGVAIPEVNQYLTQEAGNGEAFGFVRYLTTDTWQLKNTSTFYAATNNRYYLNDLSGEYVGGYTLNNVGNQLIFISSEAANIVVPGDTVKLGAVNQYLRDTLSIRIGSIKLTADISATITENADQVYALKTTTLPKEGGDLEIIFAPTAYKKVSYATITLTSGAISKSFVVSATSDVGTSKYYIGAEGQWGAPVDGELAGSTIPTLKAGDVVWIAEGEYTTAQVTLPANVSIYGGFAGTETSPEQRATGGKPWEFSNPTVLKNGAALVFSITGANIVVDGITFEGTSVAGRAIQNIAAAATDGIIRNSIVKNFNSNADGGGLNIRYKTEIYNCLITGNKGNKGGAGYLEQVTLHDCEITNNSVPTTGAKPIGNINGGGGGLLLAPGGSGCRAYNLYIAGNTASYGGGALVRNGCKLYNSVIVNNTATSGAGIAYDERDGDIYVYNVTVASNLSTRTGGSGVCFTADGTDRAQKLYNSILWNNTDSYNECYNIGVNESGTGKATPEMKNLIIDDLDFYAGENSNLALTASIAEADSAALFAANWVTSATSPGREKGFILLSEEIVDPETGDTTPATYLEFATGKDFAGKQRIAGIIDIGPYEDQSNASNGIIKTEITEGNVIATKYYDVRGIEVRVPTATGIYIKKELLDTQKVRVTKILFVDKH